MDQNTQTPPLRNNFAFYMNNKVTKSNMVESIVNQKDKYNLTIIELLRV